MGRSGMNSSGRSSGGGGMRSSGGRSGSATRSGRGQGGPSPGANHSGAGVFGRSYANRDYNHTGGHYHHHHHYNHEHGYHRVRRGFSTSRLIAVIIIFCLLPIIIATANSIAQTGNSGGITPSTVAREPLPKSASIETEYLTDELGWIGSVTKLKTGMKNFYNATGVQPYLYIADNLDGNHNPTNGEIDAWISKTYDALFRDEAHMLVLFLEYNNNYKTWYMCGTQAKAVIDTEAADILLDYIDKYYYSDMNDDEMFGKAFNDAGERIMTVTKSPWIPVVLALCAIATLLILFFIWRSKKHQKNLEAEQTAQILNAPIESIGRGTDPLSEKYDNI